MSIKSPFRPRKVAIKIIPRPGFAEETDTREIALRELQTRGLLTRDAHGRVVTTADGDDVLKRIEQQRMAGEDIFQILDTAFSRLVH